MFLLQDADDLVSLRKLVKVELNDLQGTTKFISSGQTKIWFNLYLEYEWQ